MKGTSSLWGFAQSLQRVYDGLRLGEQLDRWLGLDQLLCLLLSELLGDEGGVGVGRWYGIGRFLALKLTTVNIMIITQLYTIKNDC